MILRVTLIAVCAAAVVFGATRLHDVRACNHARGVSFAATLGRPVPGGPQRLARDAIEHCRGGTDLAAIGAALAQDGAVVPAQRLAQEAVRRDPRDYQGWVTLAIVAQRERRPAAQRAAALRALALNPRYAAARQLASSARGGGGAGP